MSSYLYHIGYWYQVEGRTVLTAKTMSLRFIVEAESHIELIEEHLKVEMQGRKCSVLSVSLLRVDRPAKKSGSRKYAYRIPENLLGKT